MKPLIIFFVAIVYRINCDRGYGKPPPKKEETQLGMTLGIEKEMVYLDKDPGQLVVQLGETPKAAKPMPKPMPKYKQPTHMYKKMGEIYNSGRDYDGGFIGGYGNEGGHSGDYGGSYGGGNGGHGGYSAPMGGGYGGGHGSGHGGGCGGCERNYGGGVDSHGGAYYNLVKFAQRHSGGHSPHGGQSYAPPQARPYEEAPQPQYFRGGNGQMYEMQEYVVNDQPKRPAYSGPPKPGQHYQSAHGAGKLEYIKLGEGQAYEDAGMVVSSGSPHRMGEQLQYQGSERDLFGADPSHGMSFGSEDFHNAYYNELMSSQVSEALSEYEL